MTEPVAYWSIPKTGEEDTCLDFIPNKNPNFENIPLYTAEHLHPRVKMTQAEFDEFKQLSLSCSVTIYESLDYIRRDKDETNQFPNLFKRLFNGVDFRELKNQWEFANLRLYYDRFNPEETIEIVPDMKWFVVDTNPSGHNGYGYLKLNGLYRMNFDAPKSEATQFDTEEEAKVWSNPFTEVMQLPVEVK